MHDLETGRLLQTWQIHTAVVTQIAYNERKVSTSSRDGQVWESVRVSDKPSSDLLTATYSNI